MRTMAPILKSLRRTVSTRAWAHGTFQSQAEWGFNQRVGQRREVEAQLITAHSVGEQLRLLLDAVLQLGAGAVELLRTDPV